MILKFYKPGIQKLMSRNKEGFPQHLSNSDVFEFSLSYSILVSSLPMHLWLFINTFNERMIQLTAAVLKCFYRKNRIMKVMKTTFD